MKLIARLLALLFVVPATYYFVYWVPFSLLRSLLPLGRLDWIANSVSLLCAITAGMYIWRKLGLPQAGIVVSMLMGAILLRAVGFVGGFFGPMLLAPEANQGPMLGLFFTGPLGFVAGAILGAIYGVQRRRISGAAGRAADSA